MAFAFSVSLASILFMASTAQAQNVIPAQIVGQPLVYMKEGKLAGCGVRLIVVDSPTAGMPERAAAVWDMSFNLHLPAYSSVKVGSYDVPISEIRSGKLAANPKRARTETGWLKAKGQDATAPVDGKVSPSDDKGFVLYITAMDSVLALFAAYFESQPVLIGTRRAGAKTDRIFSGPIAGDAAEKRQVIDCVSEFLEKAPK